MYTNIHVMSYEDCESWSRYFKDSPYSIVISIDEGPRDYTNIDIENPRILDVLRLMFCDTEHGAYGMQPEDGEKVIRFVNHYLKWRPDIVVHCAAGISRSAGIAAALNRYLNGSDEPVLGSPHYAPNFRCYRMVLDAAGVEYNEEADRLRFEEAFKDRQRYLRALDLDMLDEDDGSPVGDDEPVGMSNEEYAKRMELLGAAHKAEMEHLRRELAEEDEAWTL